MNDQRPDQPADQPADQEPRRRTPSLPAEFAPIGQGTDPPPRRSPGEPPRLRLTSAASRRNAPDRPTATAPAQPAPVPPAPDPVEPEAEPVAVPAGRRRILIALVVGCVLLVVVGGALLRWSDDGAVPTGVPVAEEPRPATSSVPPAPVEVAPDSEYVETEVVDGGDLLVTHWVSSSVPMDRFRLRTPSSPGLGDVEVDVQDLVVAADGVLLEDLGAGIDEPVPLEGAGTLYVRYRLAGGLDLRGSVDGRALAPVTALGLGLEGRALARTQVFPGGRVMTVACLGQGARAVPEVCGAYEEGAWQVRSEADALPVAVIAQLDLSVVR